MLIGNFHYSLQTKGRLAIPASFRKDLGDSPILTRGIEKNLNLLPFNTWSNLTKSLGSHPLAGTRDRQVRRLIAQQASQVNFDSQGRILIPKTLSTWADMSKKVVIAGSVDWVEIWDLETYTKHMNSLEKISQEIAADLPEKSL